MSEKQDRTYTRTASDLERKYNFGQKFSEILGLIDDSRDHVDAVASTLRSEIAEQATTIMRDTEQVVVEATKTLVKEGDFESYKQQTDAELRVAADSITANVERIEEQQRELEEHAETIGEHGEQITETTRTVEEYRTESAAGLSVLTEQVNIYAEKTEKNERQIDEHTNTLSAQGEQIEQTRSELETYKEDTDTKIEALPGEINMGVQRLVEETEQSIRTDMSTLEGEIESNAANISSYKEQQESDAKFFSDQIVLSVKTSSEYTDAATEGLRDELGNYVETNTYESEKSATETSLGLYKEGIEARFSTTEESISNVDGKYDTQYKNISKFIRFNEHGITIGEAGSAIELEVDNDGIVFKKNGTAFGWWDGTDFHTGNIVVKVSERAQFGNFAFVPRTNGSLSFMKVGD